jgi:TonB family protein
VDAGAVLLHRAAVHTPEGLTATGKVILEATLDSKGEVSDARVVSGPLELRKEALASVLQWHYQPGPAVAQISIQFGQSVAAATAAASATAAPTRVVVPRAAVPAPVAGSSTSTLNSIQFAGISPEAEQTLRNQLTVREGQTISRQDMADATEAVRAFDSHLRANFTVGNGGATTLRIAATAGVTVATGVPGGRGGGPAVAPSIAAAPLPAGIYRPGGDVTNPVPISRPEPQYSEEARKAKWSGTVLLSLVVDENGVPESIKVIKPLGLGLDEKAIEAVQQWRFRPGTKSGVPVAVAAQIEVTFRNLD